MTVGALGELISETSAWPGSIGDSAHNTARYVILRYMNGKDVSSFTEGLKKFRTEGGYVRHWEAPPDWRERDTTSDMLLPLYLAYKICLPGLALEMKERVEAFGYKSGNGDLISPGFYAVMFNQEWLLTPLLQAQAMLFHFPYRWSDSKKWFESNSDNSGDYLNFIMLSLQLRKSFISKSTLKEKVRHYYRNEPNVAFLIAMYDNAIERYL
jgi:hypothetical protein